jgi:hypothetical protein
MAADRQVYIPAGPSSEARVDHTSIDTGETKRLPGRLGDRSHLRRVHGLYTRRTPPVRPCRFDTPTCNDISIPYKDLQHIRCTGMPGAIQGSPDDYAEPHHRQSHGSGRPPMDRPMRGGGIPRPAGGCGRAGSPCPAERPWPDYCGKIRSTSIPNLAGDGATSIS